MPLSWNTYPTSVNQLSNNPSKFQNVKMQEKQSKRKRTFKCSLRDHNHGINKPMADWNYEWLNIHYIDFIKANAFYTENRRKEIEWFSGTNISNTLEMLISNINLSLEKSRWNPQNMISLHREHPKKTANLVKVTMEIKIAGEIWHREF